MTSSALPVCALSADCNDCNGFNEEKLAYLYRQTQDERYFEELYRRRVDFVRDFSSHFALPVPGLDIEGVANEVFLELRNYCLGGERLRNVGGMLTSMAKHKVQEHVRHLTRQKRGGQQPGDEWHQELEDEIADREDAPANHAIRDERCEQVHNAIATLPATAREALILVRLKELSHEEAASALNVPVGTIKSRVAYADKLLRERLKKIEF